MVLQTSGPISISDIQAEFGGTNPISISEYYAGGANVPSGAEGINGPIPSSGEIKFSDFYGAPIVINSFSFIAQESPVGAGDGIHTVSLSINSRYGIWTDPLPEIPMFGNNGDDKDGNGVQDTTSGIITMPDGFNYGCGLFFRPTTTGTVTLSLSRWNGSSFDDSLNSWWPNIFNNIIINGIGMSNIVIDASTFTAIPVNTSFLKELILPSTFLLPAFTLETEYTVTFN